MDARLLTETVLRISGANPRKCMRCGKCSGSCPNFDRMEFHPHQFADMVEKGEIERLIAGDSLFQCLGCMVCNERCPRGVEPGRLAEAARLMRIRRQDQNRRNGNDIARLADEETPQQLFVAAMRKYRK